MATAEPMDYLVVGHFHQYSPPAQGLVMGGSLKGYDEYAFGKRLRPEPAQQNFSRVGAGKTVGRAAGV